MAGRVGFPFGAAQGAYPGIASGFGWSGWAIAFLVLFIVAIVFWQVWGSVGPLFGFGAAFPWV